MAASPLIAYFYLQLAELPYPIIGVGVVGAVFAVRARSRGARLIGVLVLCDAVALSLFIAGVHCEPSCGTLEQMLAGVALVLLPAALLGLAVWKLTRWLRRAE